MRKTVYMYMYMYVYVVVAVHSLDSMRLACPNAVLAVHYTTCLTSVRFPVSPGGWNGRGEFPSL